MKNFDIGGEIYTILSGNTELMEQICDAQGNPKIFPLIAEAGTTYPLLIYRRTAFTPKSNKDYKGEVISVAIYVVGEYYDQVLSIANMVADTLKGAETDKVLDVQVTNMAEDFMYDAYVQQLYFDFEMKF